MTTSLENLTIEDLKRAVEIREEIETLSAELSQLLEGKGSTSKKRGRKPGSKTKAAKKKSGKRKLSPEGRERIREAQRKRWAKSRKGSS